MVRLLFQGHEGIYIETDDDVVSSVLKYRKREPKELPRTTCSIERKHREQVQRQ